MTDLAKLPHHMLTELRFGGDADNKCSKPTFTVLSPADDSLGPALQPGMESTPSNTTGDQFGSPHPPEQLHAVVCTGAVQQ